MTATPDITGYVNSLVGFSFIIKREIVSEHRNNQEPTAICRHKFPIYWKSFGQSYVCDEFFVNEIISSSCGIKFLYHKNYLFQFHGFSSAGMVLL